MNCAKGKVILFGEHFVVHGAEAIASPLSQKICVSIKPADHLILPNRPEIIYSLNKKAIENIFSKLGLDINWEVSISGDLPVVGGLGSSAAFCVALAKEGLSRIGKPYSLEELNALAYEGEKAFHGSPSGVDNTVSCYEKTLLFKKGKGHRFLDIAPFELLIVVSGVPGETSLMVSKVKQFKESEPYRFNLALNSYSKLLEQAKKALVGGDLKLLGKCMYDNQTLLKTVGVSHPKNDEIVSIAKENGALGAKITGGGGGGCCIVLPKNSDHAKDLVDIYEEKGFFSFVSKVSHL